MRKILLLFSAIPLVVLGVAGAFFVLQSLTVQANLRTLHATTCLGGWENAHLATGVPETQTTGVTFTSENSARLSAGTIAQIYCAFAHEIAEDSTPQRILVRFLLGIEYPSVVSEEVIPDTSIDESATAPKPPVEHIENTVIEEAAGATNNEIPAEGAGAATDGWPQGSAPTEAGEGIIIEVTQEAPPPQVLQEAASAGAAQEAALPQVLQESASAEFLQEAASVEVLQEVTQENVAVEAVQQEEAPQEANVGQENVGDATVQGESAPPALADAQAPPQEVFIAPQAPPIPDKHGPVEMLYTLDGVTWKSFGFVPKNLLSDMYFEIPIEEASDWKDISRIQISVRGVPTLDEVLPTVYLDAVWLEIEHQTLWEEARVPPGERDGDIIVSEYRQDNMSVVLVERRYSFPFSFRSYYELWLSSVPAEPKSEPLILESDLSIEKPTDEAAGVTTETAPPAETEHIEVLIEESAPLVMGETLVATNDISGGESSTAQAESESSAATKPTSENTADPLPERSADGAQIEPVHVPADADRAAEPSQPKKEWVFITDHLLSPNTRVQFADGNLFWFEPGGHAIWRFNIGTSAFESVSVNDGEVPRLYFRDATGGLRVFQKDERGFVSIFNVETTEEGVQ